MHLRSLLFVPVVALTLSSCEMFKMDGPFRPYDAMAVIPQDFLYSKYAPLNRWLDTPVHVQILDVPLCDVFNHPSLRGLNYKMVKAPRLNPKITLNHIAMTRRQLLWSIAQDHQLSMTPMFGENGEGSYIDIRAR
jgi:hypothetical protein